MAPTASEEIRTRQINQMNRLARERVTGYLDLKKAKTLDRLIQRYRPGQRDTVLAEARTAAENTPE